MSSRSKVAPATLPVSGEQLFRADDEAGLFAEFAHRCEREWAYLGSEIGWRISAGKPDGQFPIIGVDATAGKHPFARQKNLIRVTPSHQQRRLAARAIDNNDAGRVAYRTLV